MATPTRPVTPRAGVIRCLFIIARIPTTHEAAHAIHEGAGGCDITRASGDAPSVPIEGRDDAHRQGAVEAECAT